MFEKISHANLQKKMNECSLPLSYNETLNWKFVGVHHKNEWDHGYDEEYVDVQNVRRNFYRDMLEILQFLYDFLNSNHIQNVIIAPCYRYNQLSKNAIHNDIYHEIKQFLKLNNIRFNSKAGIVIDIVKDKEILEMIVEGAFRGVSELCIFIPSKHLIIAPNHHFDLAFCSNDYAIVREEIKLLLSKHPNILYYETKTQGDGSVVLTSIK